MSITLDVCHEEGVFWGARDEASEDDCPYRRFDRRAAWLNGFAKGRARRGERGESAQKSESERAYGKTQLARLKDILMERHA